MHRIDIDWGTVPFTWTGTTETIRMNHEDCPEGVDTRKRLYISRTKDNAFLAYCHNCGGRSWRRPVLRNIYFEPEEFATSITSKIDSTRKALSFYLDLSSLIGENFVDLYPPGSNRAMDKIYKCNIDLKHIEAQEWSLGTVRGQTTKSALAYPCGHSDGEREPNYQIWVFEEDGEKNTISIGKSEPYIYNPDDSPLLVIVEDRLSGIKIAQAGFASLCLHGLKSLSAAYYHALSVMYDTFVVWLDNDVIAAKNAANDIKSTLKMFVDNSFMVDDAADPKYYTEEEIQHIIKRITTSA